VAQTRRVEADLDLHSVEHGVEDRAAAGLVLALGLFALGDLAAVQLETGVLVMTTERRPLRMDSTGGRTVRTSVEKSSSSAAMRSGSALVTDTIGDLSPRPTMPRLRETSEPA